MSNWIEVCKENEFTGQAKVVEHKSNPIAVFRLNDGYYAINDTCSHDEASLADGDVLDDHIIECPMHGAQFDIKTGKNLSFPAVIPVKSYPVKVENGIIFLEIGD